MEKKTKSSQGADNIFGRWPIIDIDGNIVLCPTIATARHLALLYGVKDWPWLKRKEQESRDRTERLLKQKNQNEGSETDSTPEERKRLLETSEAEMTSGESLSDLEREIFRRTGVHGFFHDKRLMSSPRPYVVAV